VFALLDHNLHKRFVGDIGVVVIIEQIDIFETLIIKKLHQCEKSITEKDLIQ